MPKMGVPDNITNKNQFKGIRMAPKSASSAKAQKETDKGEYLNTLAGNKGKEKSIFVDGSKHNKMGKDDFLKLLAHQMKHQDPLKPTDQAKFVSDLAQFSQLEQLANMNKNLSSLTNNAPAENKFMAASFLGKKVITGGATVAFKGNGDSPKLNFFLKEPARKAIIRVFDKKNQMIQQMDVENLPAGNQGLRWNGKSLDGHPASAGDYHFSVMAVNEKLEQIPVRTQSTGMITSVNFEDGETVFTVDNKKKVFLRDVLSFHLPDAKLGTNMENAKMGKEISQKMNLKATDPYNQGSERQ